MMNLSKLFEAQKVLMERIEKEHPVQLNENRFDKRVLALLVEVGECANEQRTWKFWSKDQTPRTKKWVGINYEDNESGGITPIHGTDKFTNPLLEELVDILHFVLEVGLVTNTVDYAFFESIEFPDNRSTDFTGWFLDFYQAVIEFRNSQTVNSYTSLMAEFIYLASTIGFTWEEIEKAYYEKNKINHQRQDNSY